jgi:hypothetical protein
VPSEFDHIDGARPVQMIFHTEIDDESGPDDHRGDQERDRSTVGRPWRGDSEAAQQIGDRVCGQGEERRHPKEPTRGLRPIASIREAAMVVECMRGGEIELGPDREHDANRYEPRDERRQNTRNRSQTTL